MNLEAMRFIKKMSKLIITLFGATGDLTLRKLLPALENIIKNEKHEENITILAIGRRKFTSEDYLNFVRESNVFKGDINLLRKHLIYVEVDAYQSATYENLHLLYKGLTKNIADVRTIFYLAVSPELFMPITEYLKANKLIKKGDLNTIIAFEKPFGHTFEDALYINEYLEKELHRNQIYRVDHYLGKEMIQNIIDLRFSNTLVSALWSNKYISEVKVIVSEKDGILNRGAYYDEVGVLNDMVQSHLLQVLALLIMDIPKSLSSKDISKAKIKALKKVKYDASNSLLGQYDGYRQEKGVSEDSLISTLAFLTFAVEDKRFAGVPFYLFTGKKLAKKEAYIEVILKDAPGSHLFKNTSANRLIIELAPESRISLEINGRTDGNNNEVSKLVLDHCFTCLFPSAVKEAYEALFIEMINGHRTLFPSWEEISVSWDIICQIRDEKPRYIIYEPGFNLGGKNE